MSHLLWKYFWENDVDSFRHLVDSAAPISQPASKSPSVGGTVGSPGGSNSSPRSAPKPRRPSGFAPGVNKPIYDEIDVNSRDHAGLTLLLRAASSTHSSARDFVKSLLEDPQLDLYVQDAESGWNALHRSLYAGNVSIARMLLAKDRAKNLPSYNCQFQRMSGKVRKVGQLIKTKDREGKSPFDVYNSTVATRSLKADQPVAATGRGSDSENGDHDPTQMYGLL